MAAKALALASSIYRFGVMRELVESNPCHLIKPSDFVGEMAPRQRVLTDSEIALVWQATKGEIRNGDRKHLSRRAVCTSPAPDCGSPQ